MAVPANTQITYATVGIREDLADRIYRVAPEETPFFSNISKGNCTATYHEWQTQDLATAVDDNANLEGDDATTDAHVPTVRPGNHTQIADKVARVSGTAEAVDSAGRESEIAYQEMLKGIELRRDIDKQMMSEKGSVAGAAGTARVSGGIESWIVTNASRGTGGSGGGFSGGTTSAPTDGTQRAFTEDIVKAVMKSCFENGSRPSQIYMGAHVKQVFSGFDGLSQTRDDISGTQMRTIFGSSEIYVSDFGPLFAIATNFCRPRTATFINPDMISMRTLGDRNFKSIELAKTGDSERRQILTEYTLRPNNEKAHGVAADLSTS